MLQWGGLRGATLPRTPSRAKARWRNNACHKLPHLYSPCYSGADCVVPRYHGPRVVRRQGGATMRATSSRTCILHATVGRTAWCHATTDPESCEGKVAQQCVPQAPALVFSMLQWGGLRGATLPRTP